MLAGLHERWNSISLRTKVTSVTVLLLTLGLLVSGIGTMAMLKPALIGQLDSQLQAVTADLSKVVDTKTTMMMASGAPTDYYYAVYSADGLLLQQNWTDKSTAVRPYIAVGPTVDETTALNGAVFGVRSGNDRVMFRAISTPVTFSGTSTVGSVVVALSTSTVERLLTTYLSIFLGFGIGVVIFGALLTRFMVTTTFAPLREVEKTAEAIAAAQGNVVEVLHTRHGEGLEIGEVELRLSVETMGHEHRDRVLQALRDAGLKPRIARG